MKAYKTLILILAILLVIAILQASLGEDLTPGLMDYFKGDWMVVSLLDVYLGFALFSFVIYYFEKSKPTYATYKPTLWIIALMTMGNAVGALYLLKNFSELKERLSRILGGEKP